MERLLKFLSVFLISLIIALSFSTVGYAEELTPTKEDYEFFYSAIRDNDLWKPKAERLNGKSFILEFNESISCNEIGLGGRVKKILINCIDDEEHTCICSDGGIYGLCRYYKEPVTKVKVIFRDDSDVTESTNYFGFGFKEEDKHKPINAKSLENQSQYKKLKNEDSEPSKKPSEPPPFDEGKVKPPKIDIGNGSSSNIIDGIIKVIVDFFKELGKYGIKIMKCAIAIGVIFIGGRWLWRKLRQWLNNI